MECLHGLQHSIDIVSVGRLTPPNNQLKNSYSLEARVHVCTCHMCGAASSLNGGGREGQKDSLGMQQSR